MDHLELIYNVLLKEMKMLVKKKKKGLKLDKEKIENLEQNGLKTMD